MKTTIKLLCIWVLIFLAGCDVKDPIYNTDHPENGKVTLATDWSARTAGIDIPASYTVTVGEYSATVSNATNTLDNLSNRAVTTFAFTTRRSIFPLTKP